MRVNRIMLIILVLIITCSCSMKQAATTMTAKVIMDGMIAVESESDLWIAKQSIIPMVKSLEVLGAADPENAHFLGLMAKVYGNVAFGFLESRYMSAPASEKSVWLRRVKRYYRLGGAAGMKSLEKRFGKGVTGSPQEFTSAIKKAKEKDLSVLFWTAFDLGNWINLNRDDVTSIVMLPKVEAMVDRVLEVDPEFGYGSALAFKAAMMTSRPTMLGGNPEKAAGIFEEAIKIKGGKYLMTKVMYAEWYAIPQKRGELSRRLLSKVASADAGNLPEQTLVNELAKERASILLATYGIK